MTGPASPPPALASAIARPTLAGRPTVFAETPEQMQGLERDWKRLAACARPQNPFLSWEWQRAWLEAGVRRLRPLIAAEAFSDGRLAGLIALQLVRRHGLVQMEFLGQGSGADEVDGLLHPEAPADTAARLLGAALRRGRPDVVRLEGVRRAGRVAQACAAGVLEQAGEEPGEHMPFLRLPSSFDGYLAGQSANFRAQVRRRRRHLLSLTPEIIFDQATAPGTVSAAMEELFRLHNLRREQKHGRGLFRSHALCRFHRQAAGALAARAGARVYSLRQGKRTLAALYGLETGPETDRHFLYFQSGFDPAWTRFSPGMVLMSLVIEDCIRRGLREFDFLRGEEEYKARWTTEERLGQTWIGACTARGRAYLKLRTWWQNRHPQPPQRPPAAIAA